MKTIHLLRHAKSSWSFPELGDRERPLNKRGQRDAPRMGAALARFLKPMPMSVSPARRAQLTLQGVVDGWPALSKLAHATEEALYTFDSEELIDWIRVQDDQQGQLFLIGHNPALTDLVNLLNPKDRLDNLPTAGYAQLRLEQKRWSRLGPDCTTQTRYLFPKQLPQ